MEAEALHVRFEEDEIGPWQVIEELQFHMHFIDVRKEGNPEEAAKVWMKNDLSMPVDLKTDTLFTEALIQVENNRFFWYQRIHHIVMDGYGFSLLSQKVAKEYTLLIGEKIKMRSHLVLFQRLYKKTLSIVILNNFWKTALLARKVCR